MGSYAGVGVHSHQFKTGLEFMHGDGRKYREDQVRDQAFRRADAILLTLMSGGDVPTEAYYDMANRLAEMSLDFYKEGAMEGAALGIAQPK